MKKQQISLVVDAVILTVGGKNAEVLLIRRKNAPFKNKWALPGGFVGQNEKLKKAAKRELREETGFSARDLKEVGIFDDPKRDPRGRLVSVAYMAAVRKINVKTMAGDDAKEAQFFSIKNLPPLAFDHKKIIKKAVKI